MKRLSVRQSVRPSVPPFDRSRGVRTGDIDRQRRALRSKREQCHVDNTCKKRSNKNLEMLKNVKRDKNLKKNVCKRNKKTLPLLSVVQLHARCPRNGLQGNSEYAIQFSFAETVVVLG